MKKQVYLYCVHHMDLIWQRGWDRCHVEEEGLIRPYTHLEEQQQLRWLDLMDEHESVRHSVEQTLSFRMLLERNPDIRGRIREWLSEGRLCVDGGGESVIDTNLVCGESIVRNHLYSLKWLEREFGYAPQVAIATDTFGLSAQLPQILRGFGYDALVLHSRVFDPGELVWQGLDGSRVFIGKLFREPGSSSLVARWHAFCDGVTCRCGNQGCDACAGFGETHKGSHLEDADKLRGLFGNIRSADTEHVIVYMCSEWQMPSPRFMEAVAELESECECEVRFATIPALRDELPTPAYDRFSRDQSQPGDVSPKPEGNPACTGCYLSRIKLKQQNRELENRLAAAETWAALASEFGMEYPRGKLALLWRRMALTQFHDAVTGPHTDSCYEDLLSVGTDIRGGACRVAAEATGVLARRIGVESKPGWESFAVFNPLNWQAGEFPVTVWIDWPYPDDSDGIEMRDAEDVPVRVVDFAAYPELGRACVTFAGAALPPVGYAVFTCRPVRRPRSSPPRPATTATAGVLENDRYRISLTRNGLGEIHDKKMDRAVCGDGTADLLLEEDYGSPWETLVKPYWRRNLNRCGTPTLTVECGSGRRSVTFSGRLEDSVLSRDRGVHRVEWQQTVTLYDRLPGIHIRTELSWDTENMRVSLGVPLAFAPPDNGAFYEVPFGVMNRKAYPPSYGIHTRPNGDWPCLNSITCVNQADAYTVTLCNRGLPCHRVDDGQIMLGLARSPQIPVYISNFRGARDPGPHVFETVLFSEPGGLRESRAIQRGVEFNARFLAAGCHSTGGTLPPVHSFLPPTADNIVLSALKRSEDGEDIVVRAWETCGEVSPRGIVWPDEASVRAVDLLEQPLEHPGDSVSAFSPFQIRTFRGASKSLLAMTPGHARPENRRAGT